MNDQGWVKLHRRLLNHPRKRDPDWVTIWVHFLMWASHKAHKTIFDGKIIDLKPGQFVTGIRKISAETGVSKSKSFRVLFMLKSEQQIEQRTSSTSSLITILNWKEYQDTEHQNGTPMKHERNATGTPVDTVQECKKGRREEKDRGGEAPPTVAESEEETEKKRRAREDKEELESQARSVLSHLNSSAAKKFRDTPHNIKKIIGKMRQVDDDVDGIKMMIDRQCALWKGDPKMDEFLKPDTLFSVKFDGYYDNRDLPVAPRTPDVPTYTQIKTLKEAMYKNSANPNSELHTTGMIYPPEQVAQFKEMQKKLANLESQMIA